jgi:hypothetical protein
LIKDFANVLNFSVNENRMRDKRRHEFCLHLELSKEEVGRKEGYIDVRRCLREDRIHDSVSVRSSGEGCGFVTLGFLSALKLHGGDLQ